MSAKYSISINSLLFWKLVDSSKEDIQILDIRT